VTDFATHADQLAAATATAPRALDANSIIVDSNVLAGIKELMSGLAWKDLQPHKKSGINLLRKRAGLADLTGDPPARDLESIIGKGHDLRAANATLGESAPRPSLEREGFALTIDRHSPQYNAVLDELAKASVGAKKGAADRSIVADTMFASGAAKPSLMTGDDDMFKRLFEHFGPGKSRPVKQKPGQSLAAAIQDLYPNGFDTTIPDGAGGSRTINVIPMK